MRDLTNQRFGRLVAVRYLRTTGNGKCRWWLCSCDCGKAHEASATSLVRGSTSSCGCYRDSLRPAQQAKARQTKLAKATGYSSVLGSYKANAKLRGREWSISDQEACSLFASNCFYCGVAPFQHLKRDIRRYNGIDRVDSTKGYVPGNVVSACGICNKAKNNMSAYDFLTWAQRVSSWSRTVIPLPSTSTSTTAAKVTYAGCL